MNLAIIYHLPGREARIAEAMRHADRRGWCKQIEDFVTALGCRSLLQPVDWDRYYDSDADPYDSVLTELIKTDG